MEVVRLVQRCEGTVYGHTVAHEDGDTHHEGVGCSHHDQQGDHLASGHHNHICLFLDELAWKQENIRGGNLKIHSFSNLIVNRR